MKIDLDELSLNELKQLRKDVDAAVRTFETREKAKAREVLDAKAKELGFASLEDVIGKKGRRAKPQSKYRNPANDAETWSGRGRRPRWLEEALSKGAKLEDFLIQ